MIDDPDPFELAADGTLPPTWSRIRRDGPNVVVESSTEGAEIERLASIATAEFETWFTREGSDVGDGEFETEANSPVDVAYEFLLLGCEVELSVAEQTASLIVRFPDSSVPESHLHWEASGVPQGTPAEVSLVRGPTPSVWEEVPDRVGFRLPSDFVANEIGELLALAVLLASDWIRPDFSSHRQGWHSEADRPPQSVLPVVIDSGRREIDPAETASMRESVAQWASRNGFAGPFGSVAEVAEHLESVNAPLTGHYTVALSDGHCYIGETVRMTNRLRTHTRRFGERLSGFFVRPDTRAHSMASKKARKLELLLAERSLIHDAQRSGLFAENFREMSFPPTPFDGFSEAVPVSDLRDWVTDPEAANENDDSALTSLKRSDNAAKYAKFTEFLDIPYSADLLEVLRRYLFRCVPLPARTELTCWSLSCLPDSRRGGKEKKCSVVACLSISMTEMLTIVQDDDGTVSGFFAVNDAELNVDDTLDLVRLVRRHPSITMSIANYSELGPGVSHVGTDSLPGLLRLLDDVEITRAAASVALRVCRVGPSRQRAVHNPYLVEQALGRSRSWT